MIKKITNILSKSAKNKLKINKKKGVALAETILLTSISLVIIMTIFYPTFRNIINETLASVANWFTSALVTIDIVQYVGVVDLRRRLIILILSASIFFMLTYIYNLVSLDKDYIEAFLVKERFSRGDVLNINNLSKVYLKKDNNNVEENFVLSNNLEKYVASKDIEKGKLLLKDDLILESSYNNVEEDYEIISIKISNPEDIVSYQIEKDSIVNLYYTGKSEFASNILNDMKNSYVSTNKKSNSFDNGFVTVKLADNVKVINLFDKYGNMIKDKNTIKNELNKVDTIMFKLKKELVMKISNLKNYGDFSVSIIK